MKKLTQAFRMAIRSIGGNKGRAFLTMLGVIIGVAAVIVVLSQQAAKSEKNMAYLKAMGTDRVDVYADTWMLGKDLTADLQSFCMTLPELIEGITPNQTMWDAKIKYKSKLTQGTQVYLGSEYFSVCSNYKVINGRDIAYMDVQKRNRVVVIGSSVKDNLFNFRDPIGEKITINGESFTVIGVYKSKSNSDAGNNPDLQYFDNVVVVPYSHNRMLMRSTTNYQFIVKVKDSSAIDDTISKLQVFLKRKFASINYPWGDPYSVWSNNEWKEQTEQMAMEDTIMYAILAIISLLVGGIGIMNIMLVTVTERTREIGIRKAIGAERRSIVSQFLIEASMLSTIGGLMGAVLGTLATLVLCKLNLKMVVFPQPAVILLAVGISVFIGIIFGLFPALRASKLQPVDALRTE